MTFNLPQEIIDQLPELPTTMPTVQPTATQDNDDDDITDEEINRIIEEHERQIAEEEAEEAERLANAPTDEEIQRQLDEYLDSMDDGYDEPEMTDEDYERFEQEANSREHYAEAIQFVNRTHTSKDEGRQNKAAAASGKEGGARFATAFFTFDELVDYHAKGMTFRKLPEQASIKWSTRYLVLDFDNKAMRGHDPVNVTEDELVDMIDKCRLVARYTPSGDKKPFHFHLFVLLDDPVFSADEYKQVRDEHERRLRTALEFIRGVSALPRLTDPNLYSQTTVFAPKQDKEAVITKTTWEIDAEGRWQYGNASEHLERTIDHPQPRYTADTDQLFRDYLVPLSTAQFARWLVIHKVSDKELLKDMEYDFKIGGNLLRYMRKGATKATKPILTGERDTTVSALMLKLYAKSRSYNLWLSTHGHDDLRFSDNDIVNSFQCYLENAYETGRGFGLAKYIDELTARCQKYASLSDREYCELVKKWSTGRHEFKTRAYTRDAAQELIDKYKVGDTVKFASKDERDRVLKENSVSLATLRKMASLYRLKVTSGSKGGARSGSGRKPSVSWETLSSKGDVVDGVYYYVEALSPTEKKFIYNEGLKIKRSKKEKSEESK